MPTFGCRKCFQGDATEVWKARAFDHLATLVDDSHFSIHILRCPSCKQHAVKIFNEFVDWSGGDDAQYWSTFPLTRDESAQLAAQAGEVDIKLISHFSTGKPVLQVDYPTGKEKTIHWRQGPIGVVAS